MSLPFVIAHRGNSSGAPENSLAAFQQALDLGVDFIELDVNHTRDGHPVIVHGPGLKKTAGVDRSIHDLTLAKARQLDIGSWKGKQFGDEQMLTLSEVLNFARMRVRLAVDLKTDEIIPEIVRCIQEGDMVDEVVICGCSVSLARQVRECDSRLTVGLNMDSDMVSLAKQGASSEFHQAYVRQATYNHLSPLNMNFKYITPELVRLAHLRAIQLFAWTVDEEDDMRSLIGMGVDAIYTNFPKRLQAVLAEGIFYD